MTNKERRQIESRILNRIRRGNKILYYDQVEEVIYNYLTMVQNAKTVLEAELNAMGISLRGKDVVITNNNNSNNNVSNANAGGWNQFYADNK